LQAYTSRGLELILTQAGLNQLLLVVLIQAGFRRLALD
jgi:hypothetical protein